MKAYPITEGQKNAITKPQKYHGIGFNPRQDINGDWFIWEIEAAFCRENFGWKLKEAEFISPPIPELPEL